MKFPHLLFSLALVLIALPSVRADDAKPAKADTELEGQMDQMSGAFKKLKRQIADPANNASSLTLVATIRQGAEAALKLSPAKAEDVPAADRAKFIADYQAKRKALIGEVEKLEAALKANQNEEAKKIVAALGTMQKEGHKAFKRPES